MARHTVDGLRDMAVQIDPSHIVAVLEDMREMGMTTNQVVNSALDAYFTQKMNAKERERHDNELLHVPINRDVADALDFLMKKKEYPDYEIVRRAISVYYDLVKREDSGQILVAMTERRKPIEELSVP